MSICYVGEGQAPWGHQEHLSDPRSVRDDWRHGRNAEGLQDNAGYRSEDEDGADREGPVHPEPHEVLQGTPRSTEGV